jgi:hypothetical protein
MLQASGDSSAKPCCRMKFRMVAEIMADSHIV